jgi:hypothetical protein
MEDNIDVLNNVLDFDLVSVDREQAAGSFSVDLVGEDEYGNTVVIENQLEKSNHDHLGKLLTYMTALSAKTAVWIVSHARPEHVAAIAWLNDSSSADFYLIKVESVRIGKSPAAALLTVIVGPSDDSSVQNQKKELAERYGIRRNWWTRIVTHPEAKLHAHIKPGTHHWLGTSSGLRGLGFNYLVLRDSCGVELYIDRGKNKEDENLEIFDQILSHKDEVEAQVNFSITWERLDEKRACRIRITLEGGYRTDESLWAGIHDSMVNAMKQLHTALHPIVKTIDIGT